MADPDAFAVLEIMLTDLPREKEAAGRLDLLKQHEIKHAPKDKSAEEEKADPGKMVKTVPEKSAALFRVPDKVLPRLEIDLLDKKTAAAKSLFSGLDEGTQCGAFVRTLAERVIAPFGKWRRERQGGVRDVILIGA